MGQKGNAFATKSCFVTIWNGSMPGHMHVFMYIYIYVCLVMHIYIYVHLLHVFIYLYISDKYTVDTVSFLEYQLVQEVVLGSLGPSLYP